MLLLSCITMSGPYEQAITHIQECREDPNQYTTIEGKNLTSKTYTRPQRNHI
jgi:hypothetical protein